MTMEKLDWSKYQGVRITSAYPSVFDEKRFTIKQLREAVQGAHVLFRGWPFIYSHPERTHVINDGLETVVNLTERTWSSKPIIEQWNLLRSGAFLHRTIMNELTWDQAKSRHVLDVIETIYHVSEAIGSLWRLYEALGVPYGEKVTIKFLYEGTKEQELDELIPKEHRFPFTYYRGLRCYTPKIEVSQTQSLELWRATDVQTAAEICQEIFQQFQWEPSLQQIEDEIRPFLGRTPLGAANRAY